VARTLGFDDVCHNSLDAVSDRDFVVEQLAALALVATHLSRLAEDLILWSGDEFGFLQMGDAHSTGSSIMPQKRNPDVAELVRGKTGRVVGHLMAMLTVLKGLPLTYDKDLQEDKEALFDGVDTVLSTSLIAAEMLRGVSVRADRMREVAAANFSTATDYADYLAKKGLPFREAHELVGRLVRDCESRGVELADLTLSELKAVSPWFDQDAVAITAQRSVELRDVPGGTAPNQVSQALTEARQRVAASQSQVARRRDALPDLERLLTVQTVPLPSPWERLGERPSAQQSPGHGVATGTPSPSPSARGRGKVECRLLTASDNEFAHCAAIRMKVFVEEQLVPPEEEIDDLDAEALHVLALSDDHPVGTGRLLVHDDSTAKVGRMAVLPEFRGQGVGSAILEALLVMARQRGFQTVRLAAQMHAIPFYERFGFTAQGEVFLDAGIEHRTMERSLD